MLLPHIPATVTGSKDWKKSGSIPLFQMAVFAKLPTVPYLPAAISSRYRPLVTMGNGGTPPGWH